ncbi:hypothetical protein K3495_g2771 [Podosphaera aphanis]|nr:hypothetical protein K3495_g2771 [Podosphaera aphanis]
MFLYDSFRSYARSFQHPNRFVLLHSSREGNDSSRLTAGGVFKDSLHPSEWDEKSNVKIDSWMDSCDAPHDPRHMDTRNFFHSHFHPNRLLPSNRRKSLTRKLKKRLAAATCFVNHRCSSDATRKPACSVGSTSRESTEADLARNVSARRNVGLDVSCLSPKQSSQSKLNVNASRPRDTHSYSWSSNEMTVIDETEVRAAYRKKKPRQVTRYYSTKTVQARAACPTQHSSQLQGSRRETDHNSVYRGSSRDKAPLGRHLEWLKFLA